jgi:hypothetical protein
MQRILASALGALLTMAQAAGFAQSAGAQTAEIPFHVESYSLESGTHDGSGVEVMRPFNAEIRIAGAEWLQVAFEAFDLGRGSWVSIRSLEDGDIQTLDTQSMKEWGLRTAYLNGNAVEITLHVAPDDKGVFVNVGRVVVGELARVPVLFEEPAGFSKDICGGADDRVGSTDNRVARLMNVGCTAWRVTNGAFLTAGHCVDLDPDQGGSGLPDGVLDTLWVVQFNVPPSDSNGTIQNPPAIHQYPVNNQSVVWRFDGTGQGLGKDWAVFTVGRNSETGLFPHEVYELPFRLTRETPSAGNISRVTGFGVDSLPAGIPGPFNAQNQTNQTHTGGYAGENTSGPDIWVRYAVDTEGGNSGSPVIWEANGLAYAIHTNGGCFGGGNNNGTSMEVDALETAIANVGGTNVRYVDGGHPLPVTADGTVFRPWSNLLSGINSVPIGGTVSIVSNAYSVGPGYTMSKAMTLSAPLGGVSIGP